jgi:hypothetical protein
LPLLSICLGIIIGAFYASWYTLTTVQKKAAGGNTLIPEDRLRPMIVGALSLAIGLFWFAWTSSPDISPWPQTLAGIPIGIGVQVILLQSLAYLIDIYTTGAASAISGTMIVRSLVGGTFPLFAPEMYHKFGVSTQWHVSRFLSKLLTQDRSSGPQICSVSLLLRLYPSRWPFYSMAQK